MNKFPLFLLLFAVLIFSSFLALLFGSQYISFFSLIDYKNWDDFQKIVLLHIRLPRTLCALFVGALLAGAGAVFQGFFRNGLAEPGIMGVSSGATFGAVIATIFVPFFVSKGIGFFVFSTVTPFLGALFAVLIAYLIAGKSSYSYNNASLLLAGTALSSFFAAITSIILLLKDKELHKMFIWTLGSFNGKSWTEFFTVASLSIPAFFLFFIISRALDLLSLGETSAQSLGLEMRIYRPLIICSGAFATASAVSIAGTIGFVGLIAPHITRFFFGSEHRILIPASMCVGAVLLIFSDILARTVASPMEIPVGIITALMGTPFFLYILFKKGI